MTLFLVVLVGAMLLVAPAAMAAITVTSIAPSSGHAGATVHCTVTGTFYAPLNIFVFAPKFVLNGPAYPDIPGTTDATSVTATSAKVSFVLPADAPAVWYTLDASQTRFINPNFITYTDSLPHAFQVVPTISSLSPSTVVAGAPELTLQVNGGNFVANSSVRWNGAAVATTFNSATRLTAIIPAVKLTALGTAEVTVMNVTAGTTSAPAVFTITGQVPVVTSLSPTSVWAGYVKDDVVLTVNGSGFLAGARIVLSGGEKAGTTFVNATQLTVPLVAADISTVTTLTVSVKNPPFPPGVPSAGALLLPVVAETTEPAVTIAGADFSAWHNTPMALTFSATDSQSGVQKVQYMAPPGVAAWTDGTSYTVPVTTQGGITVYARATDWCNITSATSEVVKIDTTKPGTAALGNVSVKRGNTARLKYRVSEPAGLSPSAKVVIKIKRGNGTTAKTITIKSAPTNSKRTYNFTCNLAKGSYKWYVYATDLAGNTQENVARATLTVK
jgi:hypothetical protein